MKVKTLEQLAANGELTGKRVMIRSDLNAPHDEAGNITNETRLVASVPAIRMPPDRRRGDGGGQPCGDRPPHG